MKVSERILQALYVLSCDIHTALTCNYNGAIYVDGDMFLANDNCNNW